MIDLNDICVDRLLFVLSARFKELDNGLLTDFLINKKIPIKKGVFFAKLSLLTGLMDDIQTKNNIEGHPFVFEIKLSINRLRTGFDIVISLLHDGNILSFKLLDFSHKKNNKVEINSFSKMTYSNKKELVDFAFIRSQMSNGTLKAMYVIHHFLNNACRCHLKLLDEYKTPYNHEISLYYTNKFEPYPIDTLKNKRDNDWYSCIYKNMFIIMEKSAIKNAMRSTFKENKQNRL